MMAIQGHTVYALLVRSGNLEELDLPLNFHIETSLMLVMGSRVFWHMSWQGKYA